MKRKSHFKDIHYMLYCRCFKRHSRAALNRQQELSHLPMPPQLRLYDYLQRRKERKPVPVIDLKISKVGNVSSKHSHNLTSIYTLHTVHRLTTIWFIPHNENCLPTVCIHPPVYYTLLRKIYYLTTA